ncbi:MAG TPA: hypothetical protein VNR65_07500 [Geobacterales bacterium]|nr:hypothetical protein [Geobacterales bacterium]
MNNLIYEQWHFARPKLVKSYLRLLLDGPGDPIALQSPRRWGKTTFLQTEIMPAAQAAGFLPVYIDVWQNRDDALSAINYGLQEAIDDLDVPPTTVGKRLKTNVKKLGVASLLLELGEEPTRTRPDSAFLLVDWLLKTLVRKAKRPVLLLFDEIQELAVAKSSEAVVSALRSAITKSRQSVRVIFTGSNQDRLSELFSRSRAALYEGASILPFPALGLDFLEFVVALCDKRFRRRIPVSDLTLAFERFQYQPRPLIDLVFLFVSGEKTSFKAVLNERIERLLASDQYQSVLDQMSPLQKQICRRLAAGGDVSSTGAQRVYAEALGTEGISPGSISRALRSLIDLHVLTKPAGARGGYIFDDPMFREWLGRVTWLRLSTSVRVSTSR